ncbi:Glycine receptor subunit alpha-2, partial [Bulinus truncatus]
SKSRSLSDIIRLAQGIHDNLKTSPPVYDKPEPARIQVLLYVSSIDAINEASMDFTVGLLLHLKWLDERIISDKAKGMFDESKVESFDFDTENIKKVWVPDIFFPNEKKGSFHDIMNLNQMMTLYKDGSVLYISRLSVTLSCPMDLLNYPFDKQTCHLFIMSFGYSEEDIVFEWHNSSNENAGHMYPAAEPVVLDKAIVLPQFEVTKGPKIASSVTDRPLDSVIDRVIFRVIDRVLDSVIDRVIDRIIDRVIDRVIFRVIDRILDSVIGRVIDRVIDRVIFRVIDRVLDSVIDRVLDSVIDRVLDSVIMSNHSCIQAEFHLARNIGFYIVQMYIPSMLIVMLSWISFWLNANSVPGRVSLGLLTVLTITTQSSSVNAALPKVSYTKAIDVWMSTCLVFVFAALLEFSVVNVLSRRESIRCFSLKNMFSIPADGEKEEGPPTLCEMRVPLDGFQDAESQKKRRFGKKGIVYAVYVDVAARFLFPVCFVMFIIVYWGVYGSQSGA